MNVYFFFLQIFVVTLLFKDTNDNRTPKHIDIDVHKQFKLCTFFTYLSAVTVVWQVDIDMCHFARHFRFFCITVVSLLACA